ncbi:MAG: DUF3325 domain-containing protein [Roseateles sp.]
MAFAHQVLCSLLGFALLCLAMERHHEDALGRTPSRRRQQGLRALALLAGLASTWSLWGRADWGLAWAGWGAQLSLGAVAVVALATWRARWLPAAGLAAAAAAVLLSLGRWG